MLVKKETLDSEWTFPSVSTSDIVLKEKIDSIICRYFCRYADYRRIYMYDCFFPFISVIKVPLVSYSAPFF